MVVYIVVSCSSDMDFKPDDTRVEVFSNKKDADEYYMYELEDCGTRFGPSNVFLFEKEVTD